MRSAAVSFTWTRFVLPYSLGRRLIVRVAQGVLYSSVSFFAMSSLVKPSWNQVVIRPLKGWGSRVGRGITIGFDCRIQVLVFEFGKNSYGPKPLLAHRTPPSYLLYVHTEYARTRLTFIRPNKPRQSPGTLFFC